MTDHPKLFRPESVRGILAGRKTQTRRILDPHPFVDGYYEGYVDCTFVPVFKNIGGVSA